MSVYADVSIPLSGTACADGCVDGRSARRDGGARGRASQARRLNGEWALFARLGRRGATSARGFRGLRRRSYLRQICENVNGFVLQHLERTLAAFEAVE